MQVAPYRDEVAARPTRKAPAPLLLALLLAAVSVLPNAGCAISRSIRNYIAYNDTQNDFVMGFRNGVWARQAWHERSDQFAGEPYLGSFGDGFRAGYVAVASGGNGCPPAVPPRNYWTWKYQSPEGQAKVAAWFSGFPHGAQAAEEDQAGEYQNIQVSYAIEHQYSPAFNSSEFMQQPSEAQPVEPLPNPRFVPAPELPLNDSASLSPGPFPAAGLAVPMVAVPMDAGPMDAVPMDAVPMGAVPMGAVPNYEFSTDSPPSMNVPVAYEQPVYPFPLTAPPSWP